MRTHCSTRDKNCKGRGENWGFAAKKQSARRKQGAGGPTAFAISQYAAGLLRQRGGGHLGQDHPAIAAQGAAALGGDMAVGVGPGAVQAEQMDVSLRVPAVLLAQHVPVQEKDAHVSVFQGVPVHIGHRAVHQAACSTLPPT